MLNENGIPVANDLTEANFTNCIIYGNDDPEFLLENEGNVFNYNFTNCLLRFNNSNLEGTGNYMFDDPTFYVDNLFNDDPDFEDGNENLMRIGEDSGANGLALALMPAGSDLLNTSRSTTEPDCGAYESVIFED